MNKILWKATNLFLELNPFAMLRAPREKNLPQEASIMLPNCLFQLPFPLLLNAENGIFMVTTVSSAHLGPPRPSPGCTLETAVALEPGVGPIMSQLPIWLLSWINGFNYTSQGCFTHIHRTFYACSSSSSSPCHPHPLPPNQDTWEVAFYS